VPKPAMPNLNAFVMFCLSVLADLWLASNDLARNALAENLIRLKCKSWRDAYCYDGFETNTAY
jgi:hypothetical protein